MTSSPIPFDPARVEAFAGRLMSTLVGGLLCHLVDLGDRTGLFDAAAQGPGTAGEIATRAGLEERYVREWLSAMAAAGIVEYRADGECFHLPAEHAALLLGPGSMAPLARANTVLARQVPALERVFREGGGITYAEYCPDFSEAMDRMSRGAFDQFLVDAYVPMVPGLAEGLAGGISVADVACGSGHALVLLAAAFGRSTFVGFDLDDGGLERGAAEAAALGLDNVTFRTADAAHLDVDEPFDAVLMFDALHDQADPEAVLARIHAALAPGGALLLREPHARDSLAENLGLPTAPVLYAVSTMHCLTVSLAAGGPGIGMAFGEEHVRRLLTGAGFEDPVVLPAPGQPLDAVYVTRRA